jgi:hypothetical protein
LTFGIVISRSFSVVVEKRIEAWNGSTGGAGPGGREEEAGRASSRGFDGPLEDPFVSINDGHGIGGSSERQNREIVPVMIWSVFQLRLINRQEIEIRHICEKTAANTN